VKETSRLVSRLKHREFGVLVTTSALDRQAYEEIRNDQHPIVVISGRDIAEILISSGVNTVSEVNDWIVRNV
jgi:restriction endonuclease Mrr